MDDINLINYDEVLESLYPEKSHLLLGNGFNNSLGIQTSYKDIFSRMKEGFNGYKKLNHIIDKVGYDIEAIIGELKDQINDSENKEFLDSFINTKVKLDFMKSAHEIVKEHIKDIYQEKNKDIYLLLKCFRNYFTLNYDPLLYLLLMKFKKSETDEVSNEAIAIQNTLKFQQDDMNKENELYTKIRQAYNKGLWSIEIAGNGKKQNLNKFTKTEFLSEVEKYFKSSKYKGKTIKKAVNLLWEEKEEKDKMVNLNDGFWPELNEFSYGSNRAQNLFFLHGAFHIYNKNTKTFKFIQKNDKALYQKLEEILEREDEDVVCVFTDKNKEKEIKGNEYLSAASDKLLTIQGAIVIIGSSLSDNDKHIFDKINQSDIDTIYYASHEDNKEKDSKKLNELFYGKEIVLFDRDTISYGDNI